MYLVISIKNDIKNANIKPREQAGQKQTASCLKNLLLFIQDCRIFKTDHNACAYQPKTRI